LFYVVYALEAADKDVGLTNWYRGSKYNCL